MAWGAQDFLELKVEYEVNTQRCFNVLHYKPSGNSVGFDIQDMVNGFLGVMGAPGNGTLVGEIRKLMSEEVMFRSVSAQAVYATRYAVKRELITGVVGAIPSPCHAQNLQATIVKRGDLGNRHNVGSIRIGGVPQNSFQTGFVTAAYTTLMEAFAAFLASEGTDGISPVEYIPVIANKTQVPGSDPPKFVYSGSTVITNWEPMSTLRTQRTRTVGRGI